MKIPRWKLTCLGVSVWAIAAFGQTTIDLRTQIRNPDLSRFSGTKPLQSGSALPGSCGVGELFFKTAATAGMNLYGCTGAAQWSLLGNALHAATHRHGGSDEVGSATPAANAIPK